MKTKFIIIASQRTGSTYLGQLLNCHPNILCPGEILHPGGGNAYAIKVYKRGNLGRVFDYYLRRKHFLEEFLGLFYSHTDYEAIGHKFMYGQTRLIPYGYPMMLDYLKSNDISIIHNIRSNYLRVLVSREKSRSSGLYHSVKKTTYTKHFIDTKPLLKTIKMMKQEDEKWKVLLKDFRNISVGYEALVKDTDVQMDRILSFLNVEQRSELSAVNTRLSPERLEDMISNYDEVNSILTGTDFEYCLNI